MTGLEGFTRVEAEKSPELTVRAVRVYLATAEGYDRYCGACEYALMVQEADKYIRIFCSVEKCRK